jgi:ribosome-associated protein
MDKDILARELTYKAVRSSGPGGQHVNKVATKMVLTFDLANSGALDEKEKARLLKKLRPRLSGDEILMLSSDSSRRQSQNKDLVTRRFYEIIKEALKVPKKRKRTTPTKAAVEKRLTAKKKVAEKKITRKKPPPGL